MMAVCTVLTVTFLQTVSTIRSQRARVLTCDTNIPRPADVFTGHVVASSVAMTSLWTFFFTAETVVYWWARLFTAVSLPTPLTLTLAGFLVTRSVVLAVTFQVTVRTPHTMFTQTVASYTVERLMAEAHSSHRITVK